MSLVMRSSDDFPISLRASRIFDCGTRFQVWRLLKLDCQRLLQSAVENGVAGGVDEVSDEDAVFLGQLGRRPRMKKQAAGTAAPMMVAITASHSANQDKFLAWR